MNEFLRPREIEKLSDKEILCIADETRLWEALYGEQAIRYANKATEILEKYERDYYNGTL